MQIAPLIRPTSPSPLKKRSLTPTLSNNRLRKINGKNGDLKLNLTKDENITTEIEAQKYSFPHINNLVNRFIMEIS